MHNVIYSERQHSVPWQLRACPLCDKAKLAGWHDECGLTVSIFHASDRQCWFDMITTCCKLEPSGCPTLTIP